MKKYISGAIACLLVAFPVTSFAISVNLNLFDGDLSILDSLLLIAVGLMLIGFLLICIALAKSDKKAVEMEIQEEEIIGEPVMEPAENAVVYEETGENEEEEEPANDVVHIKLTLTGVNNGDYKIAPLRDRTTFGRRKTNDVIFSDISISGEHGVITVEKNKIYIMDNNSTNGTYINGERIREKTEIHQGDVITLGQMEYRIGF